ncbi:MAG: hypothetical protein Q8P90_00515 [bacterium]|nr:hypothetical protein [bacterium]
MKKSSEQKSLIAVTFFVIIILASLGIRIYYWLTPPVAVVSTVQEIPDFPELASDPGVATEVENVDIAEMGEYKIEYQQEKSEILNLTQNIDLGTGLHPTLLIYNDFYILGYVKENSYFVQKLDFDFKSIDDPIVLAEFEEDAIYTNLPKLIQQQDKLYLFLSKSDQLTMQVYSNDFTLSNEVLIGNQLALTDNFSIGVDKGETYLVISDDDATSNFYQYTEQGLLKRQEELTDIGMVIDVYVDKTGIVVISELEENIIFSKILDDVVSGDKYSMVNELSKSMITNFFRFEDYLIFVSSNNNFDTLSNIEKKSQIWMLADDLSKGFPLFTNTNSAAFVNISYTDDKLLLVYNVAETVNSGDSVVTTFKIFLDEFTVGKVTKVGDQLSN